MVNPKIYVLVGMVGSGKSTWVKNFLSRTDDEYVIVSSDNHIEDMSAKAGLTYDQGFQKFVGAATGAMKSDAKNAFKNGKNVIWDQTNLSAKKRRGILNQVPDNYEKIAVVFSASDKDIENRLSKRSKEQGKTIPKNVVDSMYSSYEPPQKSEGFDKILQVKT